ncbi:DUF1801 domain-containing protein [Alginatibacterium sediminis]|uniref:DUF1801 domain-containing protein n=1 Tax=Alginatibacterium sediminis TaxID=2164068 RepID=A0A420EDK3_9ALTE|nr:DUF1801 domain-containing protein [Alginatibacterium sediminis]RKF18753.1 DUF1801 domain-containing protein [Alginatibacterium sediminis]
MSLFEQKVANYPATAKAALEQLKALIFDISLTYGLGEVSENLKWGELSYGTPHSSPIRIDWKPKYPNHISIYFNCQTKLVDTFRELYPDDLEFHGNREIRLSLDNAIDTAVIVPCLLMALNYKNLKHQHLLGA